MAEHHVTREDEIDGMLRTATRAVERVKKEGRRKRRGSEGERRCKVAATIQMRSRHSSRHCLYWPCSAFSRLI